MKPKLLGGKALNNHLDQATREVFHLIHGENPTCFVCGHKDGWYHPKTRTSGIQVGHFIGRRTPITRWYLLNLFPQCSGCNKLHNTNPAPFAAAIIKKIGSERIMLLNSLEKQSRYKKIPNSAKRVLLTQMLDVKKKLEDGEDLTFSSLSVNIVI